MKVQPPDGVKRPRSVTKAARPTGPKKTPGHLPRKRLETLPASFVLAANFPNPFNPSTALRYELPMASEVLLEVFNATGQRVHTLINGQRAAGRYLAEWDATDSGGRALAAGVYFYRLRAGTNFVRVRKMLLVK